MSGLVLVADGNAERAKRIAAACSARGLQASVLLDGSAALQLALAESPAALVAHLDLPLVGGRKLAEILEANPRTRRVAVLLVGEGSDAGSRGGRRVSRDSEPEAIARSVEGLLEERERGRAAEPAPEAGLEGQLAELPLAEVLDLLHRSRKTGTLELAPAGAGEPRGLGRIYLRGGEVVQAVLGSAEGEKALFRLLAWERGGFRFKPNPVEIAARLPAPTRALLREGERQLAEWRSLQVELPPLDAHVELRVPRSGLPNVIHPLTQEVLVVLELYSRVGDVVDHCAHPDYRVLRTLQSLIERGLLGLRRSEPVARAAGGAVFSREQAGRLREWLAQSRPGAEPVSEAKLLVLGADSATTRRLAGLLAQLPGFAPAQGAAGGAGADDLVSLGRLAVDDEIGLELVQVPAAERFAPLWALAGHGALAVLLPLCEPVARAAEALRPATEVLRRQPRAQLLTLLLLEKGERVAPELLRENPSLLDDGPLFLLPLEHPEKAAVLLREMFGRVLP